MSGRRTDVGTGAGTPTYELVVNGRARTVEEAIGGHEGPGSEANESVALWRALSADDRKALVTFVSGL